MTVAIFPGSFDPVTNGHLEVITKAAKLFDQLYVVVMTNTAKKYLFTGAERAMFIQKEIEGMENVAVITRPASLTVDVAKTLGAAAIVRGTRNTQDYVFEQQIAQLNEQLVPEIATVLLPTSPKNSAIASSMIKEIAKFGGDVSDLVPQLVAQNLNQRRKEL